MDDDYDYLPPRQPRSKPGRERAISPAAMFGMLAVTVFLAWADTKMPKPFAWLMNTATILGTSFAVARWKRARLAWAAFWVLAVVCVIDGILGVAAFEGSMASATVWLVTWAYVACWLLLIGVARRQPSRPPEEVHVVHHHVLHGPAETDALTWTARPVASARPAIEAPASGPAAALRGLRRRLGATSGGPR